MYSAELLKHFLSRNVTVERMNFLGRPVLKVAYTNMYQKYVDETGLALSNAYVEVPLTTFYEGTIDVDIAAERNSKAKNPDRAGAAGVAFRIQSTNRYDLVHLRTANGQLNLPLPPAVRLGRAVQYSSLPEWTSETLGNNFPGQYEAAAKIGERRWNHLSVTVRNNTLTVFLDGNPTTMITRKLLGTTGTWSLSLLGRCRHNRLLF